MKFKKRISREDFGTQKKKKTKLIEEEKSNQNREDKKSEMKLRKKLNATKERGIRRNVLKS